MEIAVLLLLTVPLTVASPLRATLSLDSDTSVAAETVEASGLERSEEAQERHVPFLKVVPFRSSEQRLDMDAIKRSSAGRLLLRQRRAPQPECNLSTCHVHNLANTLNNIGKSNGKEKSSDVSDPNSFGR